MEELKIAAVERGLMAIRKRKNGPVLVMESKTGKSFGSYAGVEEALKAVLAVEPLPVTEHEYVGWHSDVEYVEIPRRCPNGWGDGCLCLDTTAVYLCAAPPCRLQAECRGCCRVHYSQLKVFGDLTKLAVKKTGAMAESGDFDLEHLPKHARITAIKNYYQTGLLPTSLTAGEVTKATSGVIGMNIRWTGSEYLLVDKDGKVLDRVSSKQELFEEDEDGIIDEN